MNRDRDPMEIARGIRERMRREPAPPTEDRPTDAEYIAQLESYNRTLHARIAALVAERDEARQSVDELQDELVLLSTALTAAQLRAENAEAMAEVYRTSAYEYEARGDRLEAERDEARDALRPFAGLPEGELPVTVNWPVWNANIVRARAALRATQGGTDENT